MAHPNDELIQRFYAAFAARDGAAMAACYTDDVVFSDPAFGTLRGPEAGAMWRMLTGRAEDLEVQLLESAADDDTGRADWQADYTFTQTGRKVRNEVEATFVFRDGLIADHTDTFNFRKWAGQALGAKGTLLGWTPLLQNAVRKQARAGLEQFMAAER